MISAIVPLKSLRASKSRLSSHLNVEERLELTLAMFKDVITTFSRCKAINNIIVVTPEGEISKYCSFPHKVDVIYDYGKGQIPAVEMAVNYTIRRYSPHILLIAVADMPLAKPKHIYEILELAQKENTIVLAPSMDGGTNILAENPPKTIKLMYGKNSFKKHVEYARRLGFNVAVYETLETGLDVDTLMDVKVLIRLCKNGYTYNVIAKLKDKLG